MKKLISLILILVLVFTFAGCNKKTSETTSTTKDVEKNTTTIKATTEVESSEVSTTTTLPSTTTTTAVTKSLTTTTTTTAKATTTTTTTATVVTYTEADAQALVQRLKAYGESQGLTWDTSLNEDNAGYNTCMCGLGAFTDADRAYSDGVEYLDFRVISYNAKDFYIVYWATQNGYSLRCYYI